MQADIIFDNVKAYDVIKFDVRLGESFKIELTDNAPEGIRWFFDNDPTLNIIVDPSGFSASLKATSIGKSEIQLQHNNSVIKTLFVEVYDQIAVSLNPSAKKAELK